VSRNAMHFRPHCLSTGVEGSRRLAAVTTLRSFSSAGEQTSTGLPAPARQVLEQLGDMQQKLKETADSVGLPQSLGDVQSRLQDLDKGVADAAAGIKAAATTASSTLGAQWQNATAISGNPDQLLQSLVPFASAAVTLSRASGELTPAQEENLSKVLPASLVIAIKTQVSAIPPDPQAAKLDAVVSQLDVIKSELSALREEMARASQGTPVQGDSSPRS